jgi:alkylation response protein AidB-like acyl-CoA dehydrogenase
VDLTLDAGEREVASAARSLLTAVLSEDALKCVQDAQDPAVLREVMLGIGAGGWLAGPGDKQSLFDRMPFFAAAGAALVPGLASTAVGAAVLADQPGLAEVQAGLESGSVLAAVVGEPPGPAASGQASAATAEGMAGGDVRVRGEFPLVEYGAVADVFFLVVPLLAQDGGWLCVLVDSRRHPVTRHARATFGNDFRADLSVDVMLSGSELVLANDQPGALARIRQARAVIEAIRLVECAGGARSVTRRTVSYVNTRHQFGKPLSQFQAVKQRAASMLILSEGASLLASAALAQVSAGAGRPAELIWAKSWVPRAYKDVTLSAHQLHGGMGYARESGLFRWSERAKLRQLQLEAGLVRELNQPE